MNPSSGDGLTTGTRIGAYEVLSALGAGGMGRVYLARDTKLDRRVAIKALPPEFAQDAGRLARFQREAKFLAALNHANIAGIYGLQTSGADEYLVLEYVSGESLAQKLDRGPLPVEESLEVCRQVALALEAAHEAGVIHRDLKPGNVMVTPDGTVKVLDFGLAKADAASSGPGPPLAESPTTSLTATGTITGTAGYMSPEQIRGKRVDKRTDVWSFGCVLYECLTGTLAFGGDSAVDRLSAILEREPDWAALPSSTPARIVQLLQRCLAKDPKQRLRDIGDARLEVEAALAGKTWKSGPQATPAEPRRGLTKRFAPWLAAAGAPLLAVALCLAWLRHSAPAPPHPVHLEMTLPTSAPLQTIVWTQGDVAISPDGAAIVYAGFSGGALQLFKRGLGEEQAKAIPGTDGGVTPFFSPDGRWITFRTFPSGRLMKIPLEGGIPVLVSETAVPPFSGLWAEGFIYFTAGDPIMGKPPGTLFRVPDAGGITEPIVVPDISKGEKRIFLVLALPGGKGLILDIVDKEGGDLLVAQSMENGERKVIQTGGGGVFLVPGARYLPSGQLVFQRGYTLQAIPFDPVRLTVSGSPVSIVEGVAGFSVSNTGILAWIPSSRLFTQTFLALVDRQGNARPLTGDSDTLIQPRISPDGRYVAVERDYVSEGHLWMLDIQRGTFGRLTVEGPNLPFSPWEIEPVWSPRGDSLVFSTMIGKKWGTLFTLPVGKAGGAEPIGGVECWPESWSPDGRWLTVGTPSDGLYAKDIGILAMPGKGQPKPLIAGPTSAERGSRISPDGRWIAYFSNESGRWEVYVQAFPGLGQKTQVSTEGGMHPLWSPDGRELFYLHKDEVMAVPVKLGPSFEPGLPKLLFKGKFALTDAEPTWDIAPDGQHFVMVQQNEATLATQINLVLNWGEEVKGKVAKK